MTVTCGVFQVIHIASLLIPNRAGLSKLSKMPNHTCSLCKNQYITKNPAVFRSSGIREKIISLMINIKAYVKNAQTHLQLM